MVRVLEAKVDGVPPRPPLPQRPRRAPRPQSTAGRAHQRAPGAAGERTELSVRTFENNVAKAANLLRDDADLGPGGVVALHLPLHWQAAVWLGACALVGATSAVGTGPAVVTESPPAAPVVVGVQVIVYVMPSMAA